MKTLVSRKKVATIILMIILTGMARVMSFCQNQHTPGQKPREVNQAITPAQSATIKTILSGYKPSALTASDAKTIHEKFRDAGIHAGPETRSAIIAAGFDPEKLRTLDPPEDHDNQGRPARPSVEDQLKTIQEKVIKPLSLTPVQNEAVVKSYKDFYTGMENLRKTQDNPRVPLDKSKIDPIEKARDEKIKQVISKDQFKRYQELEKASRPPRADGPEPKKN